MNIYKQNLCFLYNYISWQNVKLEPYKYWKQSIWIKHKFKFNYWIKFNSGINSRWIFLEYIYIDELNNNRLSQFSIELLHKGHWPTPPPSRRNFFQYIQYPDELEAQCMGIWSLLKGSIPNHHYVINNCTNTSIVLNCASSMARA